MALQTTNNNRAISTLSSGITDVQTSMTVQSGDGAAFPAGPSKLLLGNQEIVTYTSKSGDSFNGCSRGSESTSPQVWGAGTEVRHVITSEWFETVALSEAFTSAFPLTTKGDLLVHNGSALIRVPVGTNTHILTADSALAAGLKWAAPPAGGSGGGLSVTRLTANTTLSASGVYIVDSAAAIRTITLPLISSAPTAGWRFQIKRVGAYYVDVNRAGSNVIEPGGVTSQRLFTNYSAVTLIADSSASMWHLLGYYGAIT